MIALFWLFLAVSVSPFAAPQQFGRFRSEADIEPDL